MALEKYREKRDFKVTPEPSGGRKSPARGEVLRFVVQKHQASRLHCDFRLEWQGVLLSWAIPKCPSLDPKVKRLAMQVEDHPFSYRTFEGVIPEGQYGGGTVMVWDEGLWVPEAPDVTASLQAGQLKFRLKGKKLQGGWVLVRTKDSAWLLIKHRDRYASTEDITVTKSKSILTKRTMAKIAKDEGGDVEKAAKADPKGKEA